MKVSACVPVYNTAPQYLGEIIESVCSQSYHDYEIVICDDCSTVDYDTIVRRYESHRGFRYVRNPTNLGMIANWNAAVRHGTGELVIVLGHDDKIKPGMFAAFVDAFRSAPEIVLVSCGAEFIGYDGQALKAKVNVNHRSNIFVQKRKYVLSGREVAYLCLRNGCALGEMSAQMVRREAFEKVGGYSAAFRHGPCVDLAMRVAELGSTVYLNESFFLRRLHGHNLTWRNFAAGHVSRDRALRFECHKGRYEFTKEELVRFRAYLVACAAYDILRVFKHRSLQVTFQAMNQIVRYWDFQPAAYSSLVTEIVTGRNRDRR